MFNKLTIKARLTAVLGLMAVLVIVCAALGLYGMNSANKGLASINSNQAAMHDLTEMERLMLRTRLALAGSIMRPDDNPAQTREDLPKRIAEVLQNEAQIDRLWGQYMSSELGPEEVELARKFDAARHLYQEQGLDIAIELMRNGLIVPAQIHWVHAINTQYEPVEQAAKALIEMQAKLSLAEYSSSQVLYMAVLGIAIVSLVIGVMLSAILVRTIVTPINEAVRVAGAIAKGDLTQNVEVKSQDEAGRMLGAMKEMNERLSDIVARATEAGSSVGTGAREIAAGNMNLSQRTEEQAASLEETASSMEELTSTVRQNADNARQANQLANAARESAEYGGEVVARAVDAIDEINNSSKRVADIVGVIDEIAFQTNLLALNAAVEAARAGEQGRGFAVVASEVRNLAQRSAASAKEIKSLIGESVKKVSDGAELVHQSGQMLSEIVARVKKVTDIVAEIAAASQEQAAGIEQVNRAVMQMDEVTQQNAALVEEAAAASCSMEEQAEILNELMGTFKINGISARLRPQAARSSSAATSTKSTPSAASVVERRSANRPWSKSVPTAAAHSADSDAGEAPAPRARAVNDGKDEWQEF
jgi:methyl-accepting chemotaxis protein